MIIEKGTIRQLVHELQPGRGLHLLDIENTSVCQVSRPSENLYYVAGPGFNGDEVISLDLLQAAGEVDWYNSIHPAPEFEQARIYTATTADEATDKLSWLFELDGTHYEPLF